MAIRTIIKIKDLGETVITVPLDSCDMSINVYKDVAVTIPNEVILSVANEIRSRIKGTAEEQS